MLRTFASHLVGWATGFALVHSGVRLLTGTTGPQSFLADLTAFGLITLAVAAFPAGLAAARDLAASDAGAFRGLLRVTFLTASLASVAYVALDRISPRLWVTPASADVEWVEPRSLTSAQLRAEGRQAVATARELEQAGSPSGGAWQTVNRIAFEHELRIVQALLIPIMGLVGLLAGGSVGKLVKPWRAAATWGLALFLVLSLFMAGENGYELIVLRSSGPMAFVAWLQAVVPGCVLVGLCFASLPQLFGHDMTSQES